MTKIAGAILAGGKSSRMGRDKAGLPLCGKTLLQYMGDILKNAGIKNIYISHPDFIADIIPESGPLSGVHAILNNVEKLHKHIIFIPIDMPALTSSLIEKLISAPDNAPLVQFESYKMPFRLSTDRQWFELAERLLQAREDVSLGNFQNNISNSIKIKTLDNEQHYFQNINTSEEWSNFNKGSQS